MAAVAFLRGAAVADGDALATVDLTPLVTAILPFGTAGFPALSADAVVARMDALFQLRQSAAFRASVDAFADLAAFASGPDAPAHRASGLPATGAFASLSPAQRATYLTLWSQSTVELRRRFYTSVRAVTMIAFYSLPEVWPVIGYAGPLVKKTAP